MAGRAQAVTILEDRIYQRGQFLTWPRDQKVEMLRRNGIDVVVNMWSKVDPDLSGECLYVCWECSPSALPADAEHMISFLLGLLAADHRVLVHCEAGRGRSVWLATRLLAARTGWSRIVALAHVRSMVSDSLKGELLADLLEC